MRCSLKTQGRENAARRGSAMLMTLIMSMALASVVVYAVSDTLNASANAKREDHYARALAAAEYGAELAVAEIGGGIITTGTSEGSGVLGDFVTGTPTDPAQYANDEGRSVEQRRITGNYEGQEFRVRVRSARQVYGNPTDDAAKALIEDGWLKAPENADRALATLKAYQYRDTYEITSTARDGTVAVGANAAELAGSPVVQAVVTFDYNGVLDKLMGDTGLIHGEDSGNLQIEDKSDATASLVALSVSSFALASLSSPFFVDNITVTGEDHYLTTYHNDTVILGKIPQPMKLLSNEPNYFGATGGYWEAGDLTFNYKQPKDPRNNNDLVARDNEPINPYRPRTVTFGTGQVNRAMFVKDPNIEYDMYLLGGKSVSSRGRTVTVVDRDKTYYQNIKGTIVETAGAQAGPGANFDIVLPRFEDLRNMYINVTNEDSTKVTPSKWKQLFVGQYTHSKRNTSRIREASVPLLFGTKIRPQSIHTVRNQDKQILVRLYAGPENGRTVLYKYPITPKYEFQPHYELYRLNDTNINLANVLNSYASSTAGLQNALNDKTFVKDANGTIWYETPGTYPVTHLETGKTISSKIRLEFRSCARGQSKYGSKYYGNFWYVDANDGVTKEQPSNGFKNLNILVHVYDSDRLVLTSGNEWTGYYVWAHATFAALTAYNYPVDSSGKDGSGFFLDEAAEKMVYPNKTRTKNERLPLGRIFPWQEIVGYSLVKRTDTNGRGEPAILNQSDGGIDKRTYYARADNSRATRPAERVVTGFDEVYQGFADKRPTFDSIYNASPNKKATRAELQALYNEKFGRHHPLFSASENSPGYLRDRHDPIRVVIIPENARGSDADGKITGYNGNLDARAWDESQPATYNPDIVIYDSMDDFLFEKEFNLFSDADVDVGTGTVDDDIALESVVLRTANIMGGYEDQNETTADYDYADLMFTVYIAATEVEEDANVVDRSVMPWWERNEVEGLTGDKARLAVSFNNSVPDNGGLSSDELIAGNFDRIGSSVGDGTNLASRIWTMVAADNPAFGDFPRAAFLTGNGDFELDEENYLIAAYLKKWDEEGLSGKPVFYFTDADAMDLLMVRVANGEEVDVGVPVDPVKVNDSLIAYFAEDYVMRPIADRFGYTGDAELLTKEQANLVDDVPSSFGISREDVFVREIAGAFTGYKTYTVPTIETENFIPRGGATAEPAVKSFLAGEAAPVVADGGLSFNPAVTVPFRTDELEITGDTFPGRVRKTRLGPDLGVYLSTGTSTGATVNELYAEPYPLRVDDTSIPQATRTTIWSTFGMKDTRASIGYHRAGDLSDVEKLLSMGRITAKDIPAFLDRYEPVVLGKSGLNPFRLASDNSAVAQELQNPDDPEADRVYAPEFTYEGDDSVTFVIDRPLDGAGVMVVNGNLVVQDTFAYHGILVVTGDLIIRPTLKTDQFVWSIDGWPLDAYGHRILPKHLNRDQYTGYGVDYDVPGNWFYVPSGLKDIKDITAIPEESKNYFQFDRKGNDIRDDNGQLVPVLPLRANEYRGELVLQGKLLVKGRIITEKVEVMEKDPDTGEETDVVAATHVGKLNAYWSRRAVDAMSGMFPLGAPSVRRVSWTHNDGIDVNAIWQDKQD